MILAERIKVGFMLWSRYMESMMKNILPLARMKFGNP